MTLQNHLLIQLPVIPMLDKPNHCIETIHVAFSKNANVACFRSAFPCTPHVLGTISACSAVAFPHNWVFSSCHCMLNIVTCVLLPVKLQSFTGMSGFVTDLSHVWLTNLQIFFYKSCSICVAYILEGQKLNCGIDSGMVTAWRH